MARSTAKKARAKFLGGRTAVVTLGAAVLCVSASGCVVESEGTISGPAPVGQSRVVLREESDRLRGKAQLTLPDGEQCQGAFNTVADRVTWDDETPDKIDREDSQNGMLILQCGDHRVVRCDFSRDADGAGSGHCNDSRGQTYVLALQ